MRRPNQRLAGRSVGRCTAYRRKRSGQYHMSLVCKCQPCYMMTADELLGVAYQTNDFGTPKADRGSPFFTLPQELHDMTFDYAYNKLPKHSLNALCTSYYRFLYAGGHASYYSYTLTPPVLAVSRHWSVAAHRAWMKNTISVLKSACLTTAGIPQGLPALCKAHTFTKIETALCCCNDRTCDRTTALQSLLLACPTLKDLPLVDVPATALKHTPENSSARICQLKLHVSDLEQRTWLQFLLSHERICNLFVTPSEKCGIGCCTSAICTHSYNVLGLNCYIWIKTLERKHGLGRETVGRHIRESLEHGQLCVSRAAIVF